MIEIIVVVVILAVLMAVTVPSVLKYIDAADDAKRISEAKSILTASEKYLVYKYADEKQVSTDFVSNSLSLDEKQEIVNQAKGKGNLVSLYYMDGVIQKFTYFIDQKYVVFKGYNQEFVVLDDLPENVVIETIATSSKQMEKINGYFKTRQTSYIDSNAPQYKENISSGVGYDISDFLKKQGIDTDNVTWNMSCLKYNANDSSQTSYEIIIYNKKLTNEEAEKNPIVKVKSFVFDGQGKINQELYNIDKKAKVSKSTLAGKTYPILRKQ